MMCTGGVQQECKDSSQVLLRAGSTAPRLGRTLIEQAARRSEDGGQQPAQNRRRQVELQGALGAP